MSANMGLIYLADTLHILATFTRVAEPATPETAPDSFVGAGLEVHVHEVPAGPPPDTLEFTVAPANLKFTELALDPFVFSHPREHYLDTSSTPPKPTLFSNGALGVTPHAGGGKFLISSVISLPNVTKFAWLVRPTAGGSTQYTGCPVSSIGQEVDLTDLPSGHYHVLVCVGGYGLHHFNLKV